MFDAVTSVNTIYFWSDTIKGLSEIKRVLKGNGIFVCAVYSQEWLKRVSYTKKVVKFFSKVLDNLDFPSYFTKGV
jgi:ubiquinone/menaquinone biosynthesis C-methylase UbiE